MVDHINVTRRSAVAGLSLATAFAGTMQRAAEAKQRGLSDEHARQATGISEGYTSDAASQGNVPVYATFIGMSGIAIREGINLFRVNGYSAAGDGGDALYRKVSSDPGVPGVTQTADGTWWQYVVNGPLRIEQFGGRGDFKSFSEPATDNWQPLMDTIAASSIPNDSLSILGPVIVFLPGKYYFSQTIEPRATIVIEGSGSGQDDRVGGTSFYFPADVHGIVINDASTDRDGDIEPSQYSAAGSIIKGITVISESAMAGDVSKHGFLLHARANLIMCESDGFPGHGFAVIARSTGLTISGNANGWYLDRCLNKSCGGSALFIKGANSNAGGTYMFQNKKSGRCGIYEASGLGNQHFGFWNAGHDHDNVGSCSYGGNNYVLISDIPAVGSTTMPGTNDKVWCQVSAGAVYPEWDPRINYQVALPVFGVGNSNRSGFHGGYQEGHYSHIQNPQSADNWQGLWTRYSPVLAGVTKGAFDALYSTTGVGGYAKPVPGSTLGLSAFAAVGVFANRGSILTTGQASDGTGAWNFHYSGPDLRWDRGESPRTASFSISGPLTKLNFGRPIPTPYIFNPVRFAVGNSVARIWDTGTAAPHAGGPFSKGEIIWNANANTGGNVGWVCTASGAIATRQWISGAVVNVGTLCTNDGGKSYVCTVGGTTGSNGGPTGTGTDISDGTAVWSFQAEFEWTPFGQSGPLNSISGKPSFVGQMAVVEGVGYLAVGVSSSEDWRQITS
ncbi:hypothetical protein [Mesorhizobium sp. M0959]|uniref:hypothetical protein n=1 Tax=unclassified Mesorhizobium TaxID=325217 RepID=UPI00333B6D25